MVNYIAIHDALIARAQGRALPPTVERHHVIPKCMGGADEESNIVALTPREHYVVHQLLAKIHPHIRGLVMAATRMSKQCTGGRAYEWLRRKHIAFLAERNKGNRHGLGRIQSAETRAKRSAALRGKPRTDAAAHLERLAARNRGNEYNLGKRLSTDTRAKIATALRGNNNGAANAVALKGKVIPAPVRAKIAASLKRRLAEKRGAIRLEERPAQ